MVTCVGFDFGVVSLTKSIVSSLRSLQPASRTAEILILREISPLTNLLASSRAVRRPQHRPKIRISLVVASRKERDRAKAALFIQSFVVAVKLQIQVVLAFDARSASLFPSSTGSAERRRSVGKVKVNDSNVANRLLRFVAVIVSEWQHEGIRFRRSIRSSRNTQFGFVFRQAGCTGSTDEFFDDRKHRLMYEIVVVRCAQSLKGIEEENQRKQKELFHSSLIASTSVLSQRGCNFSSAGEIFDGSSFLRFINQIYSGCGRNRSA